MKGLKKELCKFIVTSLGFVPPPGLWKCGMASKEFLIDKKLSIESEDELGKLFIDHFNIWCGKLNFQGLGIRVLATHINYDDYHEFIIVYKLDNSPMHVVKTVYGEEHNGLFVTNSIVDSSVVENQGSLWKPVGLYNMLSSALGFERMVTLGQVWEPCSDYEDLFQIMLEAVDL